MINKKYMFIMLVFLIFIMSASCRETHETPEEISIAVQEDIEFAKKIEAIDPAERISFIRLDNMHDMIEQTKVNLIIRGKIIEREESRVISPNHTNEDLKRGFQSTLQFIRTPYHIRIDEVYHGEINEAGDIIIINAWYGIVDGYKYRSFQYPIFNIDTEYILLLRIDEVFGELYYQPAFKPASCLKLDIKNDTFENIGFGSVFSEYESNLAALLTDLKNLISDNNYNLEIEKYPNDE